MLHDLIFMPARHDYALGERGLQITLPLYYLQYLLRRHGRQAHATEMKRQVQKILMVFHLGEHVRLQDVGRQQIKKLDSKAFRI